MIVSRIHYLKQKEGDRDPDPKVGDWVQFYSNGELVMAEVRHVFEDTYRSRTLLVTDRGQITPAEVIERRRRAK